MFTIGGNGGGGGAVCFGSGGSGGIVIFEYQSKTGSGIIDVSGGNGAPVLGSGAYSTTAGGSAGGAGSKGIVFLRKIPKKS